MKEALKRAFTEVEFRDHLAVAAAELGLPNGDAARLHGLHRQAEGDLFDSHLELAAGVYLANCPDEVDDLVEPVKRAAFRSYAETLLFIDGHLAKLKPATPPPPSGGVES